MAHWIWNLLLLGSMLLGPGGRVGPVDVLDRVRLAHALEPVLQGIGWLQATDGVETAE